MKKATEREVGELIDQLRIHFGKVRENAEFLKLKELELRPDDWISQTMLRDAEDQLRIEKSLLVGHAHMIVESIGRGQKQLPVKLRQILLEIGKQDHVV